MEKTNKKEVDIEHLVAKAQYYILYYGVKSKLRSCSNLQYISSHSGNVFKVHCLYLGFCFFYQRKCFTVKTTKIIFTLLSVNI